MDKDKMSKVIDSTQQIFQIKGKGGFLREKLTQYNTKREKALYCAGLIIMELRDQQDLQGKLPKTKSRYADPIINTAIEDITLLSQDSPDVVTSRDENKNETRLIRELYKMCLDANLIQSGRRSRFEKIAKEKIAGWIN